MLPPTANRQPPTLLTILLVALVAFPVAAGDLDATRATLRERMVRLINRDRQAFGLRPVALDAQASAIGDAYCEAQLRNRTTGHFTIDGLAPYMRYSFAGGNDGVSENAAAWSADYTFNERALVEMLGRSQDSMMAERPPRDGHRKTILDPHATHVGIGLAWEKGEFR
ncbi:MAG TPA: CAP domain-containing protein, partial [Thermoanaerobaculia bacterium]|nr:CAP domain-containing protein [Thermoanaerobaculia bacterium]